MTPHPEYGWKRPWYPRCVRDSNHGEKMHRLTVLIRGTAGGSQFGVAKAATLIAVKVLDDSGYVGIEPSLFSG